MNKKILFLVLLAATNLAMANEGVCKKCEIIREENKHKVNPYHYYEDYLKDHPEGVPQASAEPSNQSQQNAEPKRIR